MIKPDITGAWSELVTYMEYGERLTNQFPEIRSALAFHACRIIERNISREPEHQWELTEAYRRMFLPLLNADDINALPVADTIEALNMIYFMLFTEIQSGPAKERAPLPVPETIAPPTIIKDIILRHRDKNYLKNSVSVFMKV